MQNKIQVEVSVKFESGATITLAQEQKEAVVYFINHMLFGETPKTEVKEKRKYTQRRKVNRWTEEEENMVREAMNKPLGRERRDAYKFVAREIRRGRSAVYQKAVELRAADKKVIAKKYQPLHSIAGLLG